ncbi:hypothetical protein Btru_048598 [Bulinus truncatus]|nr:hypothetical protein Btru_048598 [Bulinus truncatus]
MPCHNTCQALSQHLSSLVTTLVMPSHNTCHAMSQHLSFLVTTLVKPCHNTCQALSQHLSSLITTLVMPSHNTYHALSQHLSCLDTTLVMPCHNTCHALSQHLSCLVTTLVMPCHNACHAMSQRLSCLVTTLVMPCHNTCHAMSQHLSCLVTTIVMPCHNACHALSQRLSSLATTLVKPCHNTCQALSQRLSSLVTTLVMPYHIACHALSQRLSCHVTTLVKPCHNTCHALSHRLSCHVTTLVKPCHNTCQALSQHLSSLVTTLVMPCRNACQALSQHLSCLVTSLVMPCHIACPTLSHLATILVTPYYYTCYTFSHIRLHEPLKLLIQHGAKVDFFMDDEDSTESSRQLGYLTIEPLNMALENNHLDCARLLLENGAKPNNHYFLGYEINLVPLENLDCLKLLLEFGADPNVFSRCGLSPLMKACRQHNIRAVRLLLEHGVKLDLQPSDRFEQKTAIHYAVQSGSTGITNAMLRRGALITRPPGYRYSALHTAIMSDEPDMCELLLRWEAYVEETTDENSTPLQLACASPGLKNRLAIVEKLLEHGANPNANSPFLSYSSPFLSPLTEYMRCETDQADYDVVHALILYGAKVHFRAASTASRAKDPHGILHCVQHLKKKPEVFHLMVSASTVFDVDSVQAYSSLSPDQRFTLLSVSAGPRDLRTLTHLFLRDYLKGRFQDVVKRLPLPSIVKLFLLFNPSERYREKNIF